MVSELVHQEQSLDRLFVQDGGGALASACVQGFREAAHLGVPIPLPRINAVQPHSAYPLHRAWERVVAAGLDRAVHHRAELMWPWEAVSPSVALVAGLVAMIAYAAVALRRIAVIGASVIGSGVAICSRRPGSTWSYRSPPTPRRSPSPASLPPTARKRGSSACTS